MTSALEAAEQAVAHRPDDPGLWYRLGLARLDSGQIEQSEPCWRKVLALDPGNAKASVNLGLVLQHAGKGEEALEHYRNAVAADPALGQAWFNLGALLLGRGLALEAIDPLRAATTLDPGRPAWLAALGEALGKAGRAREAVESLRAALRGDASLLEAHSELLKLLNLIPDLSPQRVFEEHVEWARRHAAAPRRVHENSRDPERRIRIGYVAADFRLPSIGILLQPVLAWHDKARFEVYCYSDAPAEDPVSWRLRARDVAWRSTAGMSNEQLVDGVREDRIDVLIDLSGHGGRRMPLFASKPAPVQASWLGYPSTTGLEAIDYRIVDAYSCPDGAQAWHIERLVRLPARFQDSPLSHAEQFTRTLESAYRQMWRGWCAGEVPRAFDVAPAGAKPRAAAPGATKAGQARPPRIVLDGVFFQDFNTGISRVWQSLLQEWVASGFAERIVLLDRQDTAPRIPGVRRRVVPRHAYDRLDEDRAMLQRVCEEEKSTVFASTYYSSPLHTPSVMTAYDMIPEVFGSDLRIPMWREKDACIRQARRYVAISENTARDLCNCYPEIDRARVTVAHCGVSRLFRPAATAEVEEFKRRHKIARPYFLLVGTRLAYKNAEAFVRAFARFRERDRFALVCVGGEKDLSPELAALREGSERHVLELDDEELRLAYCGAVALAYPSTYEGFGMPVLEAMASGCPVITTPLASLPEVAGEAALYVKPMDEAGLENAMRRLLEPALRDSLAAKGLEQARKFSWTRMAGIVAHVLTEASA